MCLLNISKKPHNIYKHIFALCASQNVTAGTVCPAAHFCVFGICIITNNAEHIKNINHKPFPIYKHIFALYVFRNVTAHAQSTSATHFSCSSKCRRTSLYKSYHRVFDSLNQKARVRAITFAPPYMTFKPFTSPPTTMCQYSISPNPNPIGGDTPFYAFGYKIKDFYLTRKKTGRRYRRHIPRNGGHCARCPYSKFVVITTYNHLCGYGISKSIPKIE